MHHDLAVHAGSTDDVVCTTSDKVRGFVMGYKSDAAASKALSVCTLLAAPSLRTR